MIVYVDIEHERLQNIPEKWQKHLSQRLEVKYRLEEISGDHCLIMRYDRLSPDALCEVKAKAVLISGNTTEFQYYEEAKLSGLRAVFREAAQPTLGFCGGFQMMAEAFGITAGPIVSTESGDMDNDSWKERTHEFGFTSVFQSGDHPFFTGLGNKMMFFEAHYWDIKDVPIGFQTFAQTEITPIQFMAHETLPLFGTQFHPEVYNEDHLDGRHFLENFFKQV